ncbi:Activator of Hsp90 ATPase 1 family protein [Pseudopedobacter saltans DSM 12145]|uniref:Activator of Hsp90 ATPase 1 family protein n=1 Tax=Pseudopedobacter saltans (strain ATCC 51119 / DSM 12145 / JCM 21818 / CCUG 39354 / LMG 10337 / NBRC 100064 / NCIMB 13643) TaxID=762903 RepID=F0S962_PSESL|nr:SRPBCC family protein [Pseudopedobacter saltans]ADY51360.1 Activator of Hsp90 ATPase 1 family protein [Pseudopedobacter saltans DSM 12145]
MFNNENKEIRISKTLNFPLPLVWEAWTNPEYLVNWWGPKGFTSTIQQMDLKEGGEWKLVLHGPDGTDYTNRSIFKEVIPLKKIVFEHFNPHFITTVVFESLNDKTVMDWRMLFDSEEMRNIVVTAHKAEDGQKENVEKLEHYLREKIKEIEDL